jgi:hypothetical protein
MSMEQHKGGLRLSAETLRARIAREADAEYRSALEELERLRAALAAREARDEADNAARAVATAAWSLCEAMDGHPERLWEKVESCGPCDAIRDAEGALYGAVRVYREELARASALASEPSAAAHGSEGNNIQAGPGPATDEDSKSTSLGSTPSGVATSPAAASEATAEELVKSVMSPSFDTQRDANLQPAEAPYFLTSEGYRRAFAKAIRAAVSAAEQRKDAEWKTKYDELHDQRHAEARKADHERARAAAAEAKLGEVSVTQQVSDARQRLHDAMLQFNGWPPTSRSGDVLVSAIEGYVVAALLAARGQAGAGK